MSFLSSLMNALPGAVAQGLAWGIMAIGVYITFRILDVADLTVDGSLATGGAVCVMLIRAGVNPWLAMLCALVSGMLAGLVTGLFHTRCGIPAILAGILTQLALYSINLRIMGGKANQAVSVDKYHLLLSQRYVRTLSLDNPLPLLIVLAYSVFKLPAIISLTIAVAMAAPSGAMCTMFAVRYDRDAHYASEIFAATTILSMATLPLIVWVAGFLL